MDMGTNGTRCKSARALNSFDRNRDFS